MRPTRRCGRRWAIRFKLANDIAAILRGEKSFDSAKAIDEQAASYGRLELGLENLRGKSLVSEQNYQRQLRQLENNKEREAIAALEREYGETADVVARKLALRRKENEEERAMAAETQRIKGELVQLGLQQIQGFSDAYFTIESQNNQAALENMQGAKQAEVAVAGENAELKAQIEEKYRKKELEAKRKQAQQDKVQAAFNVALNTAQAVTAVLSTGGGTRYADFGISAGVLSALVIAQGLAQLVAIEARPLPNYFKGRRGGPAETALVAERGPELIGQPGSFRVVAEQAVTRLAAGDRVYTAPETRDVLRDHELVAGRLVARRQQDEQARQASALRVVSPGHAIGAAAEARAAVAARETDRIVAATERNTRAIESLPQFDWLAGELVRVRRQGDSFTQEVNSRYKGRGST